MTLKRRKSPTFAAMAAQAKIAPQPEDAWEVKYFKRHPDDDAAKACPGREYLRDCPPSVAAFFSVVIVQVAGAPPTKFGGGGYWEAIGTKPLLTVLCGMTKPDRTVFSDADYAEVRALGDEYLARNPRSVA